MTTKATSPAEIRQLKFAIRTQTFGLPPTEHRFIDTLLTLGRAEAINAALEAYADHLSADPSGGSTLTNGEVRKLAEQHANLAADEARNGNSAVALFHHETAKALRQVNLSRETPPAVSEPTIEQIARLRAVERVWRLRGDAIEQADDLAALLRWASSRSMDDAPSSPRTTASTEEK